MIIIIIIITTIIIIQNHTLTIITESVRSRDTKEFLNCMG